MKVNDYGKIILLTVALIGGITMTILGSFWKDPALLTAGAGMAGGVIGYLTGNGRTVASGSDPVPALGPKDPQRRAEDRTAA